jgi:quercetin 2,3-dioxygenase
VNLPKEKRRTTPRVQDLPLDHVPSSSKEGVHIKLYSGSFSSLKSPVLNYVPIIIADITIEAGTSTIQHIPANYNTFLYVIQGSVTIGEEDKLLNQDQVGWLNLLSDDVESELKLIAGEKGVRFILYAGKPTGETIISHGPFIADSAEDIQRLYKEFRQGQMKHISTVSAEQKIEL